jgi:2-dehydro-3-deoxygalactonokinase
VRKPAFVAVDWGTSSFRGWLMAADGRVLAETRGPEGMLHCATAGFAPVLTNHRSRLGATLDLPVLICGMAGAKQGWIEAPYLHTPTRLEALHDGAQRVDTPGDIRILPGIAQADAAAPDVMRGEETQLLGVTETDFTGLVCIPGTHSKWIRIENGGVVSFTTYMTGELFSVIAQHSILKHAVEHDAASPSADDAFRNGLQHALDTPAALPASLFGLRAAQLLGFQQRADGAARLSGLLIGTEIADAGTRYGKQPVRLICAGALGDLYAAALTIAGFATNVVDAERASQQGLTKAAIHLWGAKFA